MKRSIVELKDRHKGEDIWVIAAGPSGNFIDPSFFEGKRTLGVNRVWKRFRTDYLVLKESNHLQDAIRATESVVIGSRYSTGNHGCAENDPQGEWYMFEHENNGMQLVNLDVIGTDKLVVSWSTITSGMHAAAYLGARNIILVGHDCGLIDGVSTLENYGEPLFSWDWYKDWLSKIEPQSVAVRNRLREVYGCNIYSLNPWLNFGLEGHSYVRQ